MRQSYGPAAGHLCGNIRITNLPGAGDPADPRPQSDRRHSELSRELVRSRVVGHRHTRKMSIPENISKSTAAFLVQCVVAFAISFVATVVGIVYLPLDPWQRLFLAISVLFLVSSSFGLAKVVRDQQEASTVRVRIDEARLERLLAEHDPLKSTVS